MAASEVSPVPAVGELAPDFTLKSTADQAITLSSLRGRPALIAFFPLAFSGTCTAQLCEMRDEWAAFESRGIFVLPISVDHLYSLKEYKAKFALPVDLLSDFKRDVSRQYGVLLEDRFYSNRAYFLLDGTGVIRWQHIEENPSAKRTNAELLMAIDNVGA